MGFVNDAIDTVVNALTGGGANLADIATGFKHGYVFELIDTKNPANTKQFAFVLAPSKYTLSEPFQTTLTPTEANTVVEETYGIIVRDITIEGTFGNNERTGPQGTGSGNAQYLALRALFQEYSDLKKDPTKAAYTKLAFHSLREPHDFYVVPQVFETPRDAARTRTHYEYRIVLKAIADALPLPPEPDGGFSLTDLVKDINEAITETREAIGEVNVLLAEMERYRANITAVMINISGLITAASNVFNNASNLVNVSRDQWRSGQDSLSQAIDDLEQSLDRVQHVPSSSRTGQIVLALRNMRLIEANMDRVSMYPQVFIDQGKETQRRTERAYLGAKRLTEQDIEDNTAGASGSTRTLLNRGSDASAGVSFGDPKGFLRVPVTRATTLEVLANKYSVSPELIVLVNNLRAPYFAVSGGNGVKKPGDYVLIPLTKSTPKTAVETATQPGGVIKDTADVLYGVDLALDADSLRAGIFEIAIDTIHGSLDCQVQRGTANVVQGTTITVNTGIGETQFLSDVGIPRTVGRKGTLENVLLSSINFKNAILADTRVTGISQTVVELVGDELRMAITPEIRGRREDSSITLPLGSVSGL